MATSKIDFADVELLSVEVEQLCEVLSRPAMMPAEVLTAEFDRLAELVAALPLTTDEYRFAANWATSARRLFEAGDVGACRYQLGLVRRKLTPGKTTGVRSPR